jgi:hypothetical protein
MADSLYTALASSRHILGHDILVLSKDGRHLKSLLGSLLIRGRSLLTRYVFGPSSNA